MNVKVNGETKSLSERITVHDMLLGLGIDPRSVVVERNLRIIPRSELANEFVEEGDTVEIIRLVGGG